MISLRDRLILKRSIDSRISLHAARRSLESASYYRPRKTPEHGDRQISILIGSCCGVLRARVRCRALLSSRKKKRSNDVTASNGVLRSGLDYISHSQSSPSYRRSWIPNARNILNTQNARGRSAYTEWRVLLTGCLRKHQSIDFGRGTSVGSMNRANTGRAHVHSRRRHRFARYDARRCMKQVGSSVGHWAGRTRERGKARERLRSGGTI